VLSWTSDQPLARHEVTNICQATGRGEAASLSMFLLVCVAVTGSRWETNKNLSFVPLSSCYCASIHTKHMFARNAGRRVLGAALLPLPQVRVLRLAQRRALTSLQLLRWPRYALLANVFREYAGTPVP
jgi:hypothetical protein